MAADDSGPLRHRYGSMRDLVVGTTVALSDGTLARSGGKVIKNVAGYDLAQAVHGLLRHARPDRAHRRAAAPAAHGHRDGHGATDDPARSARRPSRSPRQPLEADCLDAAGARAGPASAALRRRGRGAPGRGGGRADRGRRARAGRDRGRRRRAVGDPARAPARPRPRLRDQGLRPARPTCPRPPARRPRRAAASSAAPALGLSWLDRAGRGRGRRRATPLAPRACTLLDAPEALRGARLGGAGGRRARGHGARQGALRPRADLPPGHLRGRDLRRWRAPPPGPGTSTARPIPT